MGEKLIDVAGWIPARAYFVYLMVFHKDDADSIDTEVAISETAGRLIPFVLFAFLLGLVTDFGGGVKDGYYEAIAQILAVLALAGFVELLPAVSITLKKELPKLDEGNDDDLRLARVFVVIHIGLLVGFLILGETAALWALATGSSSTFLVVLTSLAALAMIRNLVGAHFVRYGSTVDRSRRAVAARIKERAASS